MSQPNGHEDAAVRAHLLAAPLDALMAEARVLRDAGHDYARIRTTGFSKRLVLRNGEPCLH